MKPRMFIGSSSEHLNLAYAVQASLDSKVECTVWTQGVFKLSQSNLTSLLAALETDFGVFVFAPDDLTEIRGSMVQTVRDNVVFELGLFVGHLGSERCFIVQPRGADLHLPTDLLGVSSAMYEPSRSDGNWRAALGPACFAIGEAVGRLGPLEPRPSVRFERPLLEEQKRNLRKELSGFKTDEPLLIIYPPYSPYAQILAFQFRNFFLDFMFIRGYLSYTIPDPDQWGVMVAVRDLAKPPPDATFLLSALDKAGFPVNLVRMPEDIHRSPFALFIGDRKP